MIFNRYAINKWRILFIQKRNVYKLSVIERRFISLPLFLSWKYEKIVLLPVEISFSVQLNLYNNTGMIFNRYAIINIIYQKRNIYKLIEPKFISLLLFSSWKYRFITCRNFIFRSKLPPPNILNFTIDQI